MTDLSNAAKKARDWTAKRDGFIHQQHAAGLSLRAIAEEAGLSHTQIANILARPQRKADR